MLTIRRDVSARIECARDAGGGLIALFLEDESGQWSMLGTLELGPFDTGLDASVWLLKQLKDAGVLMS